MHIDANKLSVARPSGQHYWSLKREIESYRIRSEFIARADVLFEWIDPRRNDLNIYCAVEMTRCRLGSCMKRR